ncbi:MAG TPA: N,N-dimethylformamidase beta subunit family domain-containing protein [Roseimicrobium sp.]|nr:N,N-dimethylformamidase beta subunit family domain-containing protein [Roseimicrobium sp.]
MSYPASPSGRNTRNKTDGINRRDALKAVGLGLGATALAGCTHVHQTGGTTTTKASTARQPDLIRKENQRQGTKDWMLVKTGVDPKTKYRCPWIEGYCSRTSVKAGEKIAFHVSTNPASAFRIDIYRTGYYGGLGGRHMTTLGSFKGVTQPEPAEGPKRLKECRWEPCTEFTIPADWVSGVYVGKLTAEKEGWQSYVIFIVRDDRKADFLFQCSDTTWQAYNRWPNQYSLYDNGKSQWYWGAGVDISFDRPYGKYCQIFDAPLSTGSGEWFLWEFPIAYWLEQQGYDITYISNLDSHTNPASLLRAKGLISVGHDEYYSIEMFNQLKAAVQSGLNIAFLSGNTCCGRIQFHPSATGVPNRIFERIDAFGPFDPRMKFSDMNTLPRKSPWESELIGARSIAPVTGGGPWVCSMPDHWIFAGTGMKQGDSIPGLVGWEWHGDPAKISGLEVISTGPTRNNSKTAEGEGIYTATVYPGPKGNIVFNASSCWWGDGLSAPPGYVRPAVYTKPEGPDIRAQRITANVLQRMLRG